jgi:hypothetical protein
MSVLERQQTIESAIKAFATQPLYQAGIGLLDALGYRSDRTLKLSGLQAFCDALDQQGRLRDAAAKTSEWVEVEFLRQITDEDISNSAQSTISFQKEFSFQNFAGLHQAWAKRLTSYVLSERFYREVANWYFWALKASGVVLPPSIQAIRDPKEREKQQAIFFIRLLTRLIFCWFLQAKGFVPRDLFHHHVVEELLKDPSPAAGTYYKAFLQNLFFATLNQEQERRGWRKKYQGPRDGNRGVTTLWCYQDLLTSPARLEALLRDCIPFVRGAAGGYGIIPQLKVRAEFLLGLLNSRTVDFFYHSVATQMRGGWYSYESRFIRNLPIAPATQRQEALVVLLVEYLLWLHRYCQAHPVERTSRDVRMLGYWEQVLNGLVYELYFPEALHACSLHLFDLVQQASLPELDAIPELQRLSRLRQEFAHVYDLQHPLRAALYDLQTVEEVRIIAGQA